ncbi:hypothetical protein KCP77_22275 [Salmonella enterica subsp. enterica]|nr:hypothetical protein KCP77_22275 [Salmonella enterica subsp. enterica]
MLGLVGNIPTQAGSTVATGFAPTGSPHALEVGQSLRSAGQSENRPRWVFTPLVACSICSHRPSPADAASAGHFLPPAPPCCHDKNFSIHGAMAVVLCVQMPPDPLSMRLPNCEYRPDRVWSAASVT